MNEFPRIVFFGTPDFAVASLERLVGSGFTVSAVVTAPDKPAGRGLKESASPVKVFAGLHHIPVLQPVNLKDPLFLQQLSAFRPDLQIVIAFRMIPKQVWALPPFGTFNLHASLLPQYRGAAPINRAIMNGETESGITTFFLNEQIDTGKIIGAEKIKIGVDETAGELHDRLMLAGAGLVVQTVRQIVSGNLNEIDQESLTGVHTMLKTAPKIFKEDCRIDWSRDVASVYNFIRGLSPHPAAFTELVLPDGTKQTMKIFRAIPEQLASPVLPGKFLTDGKSFLKISAGNGYLHLEELQLSGRKVMQTGDFLRGFGRIFSETHGI